MALFYTRGWVSTKGTHANNFTAGQDLLENTWVKETFDGSNIVVEALPGDIFLGFVIQPKGSLQGQKVDILLGEWRFNGGAAQNGITVDAGCPTVTDDANLGFIVGSVWFDQTRQALYVCVDATIGAAVWLPETHFHLDTVAPTAADDFDNCYYPGFYWYDTVGGTFYLCIDATVGAAVWVAIGGGGLTDVLIGRTLHVASNGNDGTAIPNSLVFKYATIEAAWLASTLNDTIIIWPGAYICPNTLDIDGSKSGRYYCHDGVEIVTPASGQPMFNIAPGQQLDFLGHARFLARTQIFQNSQANIDICRVQFECELIQQIGAHTYWCDFTSCDGSAKVWLINDMMALSNGWCNMDFAIDKNITSFGQNFDLGSAIANNGLTFNTTYGVSRFQLRGRNGKYANITTSASAGASIGSIMNSGSENRDCRKIKICADMYAFNCAAFMLTEGTCVWEGSGFSDKDPPPTNDQIPFFDFLVDNVDFYFEHRMGSVNSILDNTLIRFMNSGTVRLCGNYVTTGESYPLVLYNQTGLGNGNRLILDGNFRNDGPTHLIEYNDNVFGSDFLLVFGKCTAYCSAGGLLIESNTGNPAKIYTEHSLISNTNYNAGIFTDVSLGGRHVIDGNYTNYIPSEHLR